METTKILNGGHVATGDRPHRCKLPRWYKTFRWTTNTVVQCLECDQKWILAASYSMIDDSRCWQKYDLEYWTKIYSLEPGEYPPLW